MNKKLLIAIIAIGGTFVLCMCMAFIGIVYYYSVHNRPYAALKKIPDATKQINNITMEESLVIVDVIERKNGSTKEQKLEKDSTIKADFETNKATISQTQKKSDDGQTQQIVTDFWINRLEVYSKVPEATWYDVEDSNNYKKIFTNMWPAWNEFAKSNKADLVYVAIEEVESGDCYSFDIRSNPLLQDVIGVEDLNDYMSSLEEESFATIDDYQMDSVVASMCFNTTDKYPAYLKYKMSGTGSYSDMDISRTVEYKIVFQDIDTTGDIVINEEEIIKNLNPKFLIDIIADQISDLNTAKVALTYDYASDETFHSSTGDIKNISNYKVTEDHVIDFGKEKALINTTYSSNDYFENTTTKVSAIVTGYDTYTKGENDTIYSNDTYYDYYGYFYSNMDNWSYFDQFKTPIEQLKYLKADEIVYKETQTMDGVECYLYEITDSESIGSLFEKSALEDEIDSIYSNDYYSDYGYGGVDESEVTENVFRVWINKDTLLPVMMELRQSYTVDYHFYFNYDDIQSSVDTRVDETDVVSAVLTVKSSAHNEPVTITIPDEIKNDPDYNDI